MVRAVDCGSKLLHSGTGFGSSYKRIFFRDFQKNFEWERGGVHEKKKGEGLLHK